MLTGVCWWPAISIKIGVLGSYSQNKGNMSCQIFTDVPVFNIYKISFEFIFWKASYIQTLDSKGSFVLYESQMNFLEKLENRFKHSKLGLHSLRSGGTTQAENSGVCDTNRQI